MLARRPSDVLDNLLSRFLQWSGLLSHLRSYERYDEPETLPYSIRPFCPMSADAGSGEQLKREVCQFIGSLPRSVRRYLGASDDRSLPPRRKIRKSALHLI